MMESETDETYFDASFFVDESYVTKEFVLGPHTIKVMCLQASSTDFDLTGQLIWPGAELLNNYLVQNFHILQGLSVIELGSGVGLTGLLCAHYCHHVVMTDHNATILKVMQRNVDSQTAVGEVECQELEWGNEGHLGHIHDTYPLGFDLILGADILYQQSSFSPFFKTAKFLMALRPTGTCRFLLGYISRANSNNALAVTEANKHNLLLTKVPGSTKQLCGGTYEGWVYEISMKRKG
ncbi:hypothetical protein BDL97_04G089700 [Sphagnum fallax]|nr:hypothetical protein BDL97_04G089700 [Sphagnum fallax]